MSVVMYPSSASYTISCCWTSDSPFVVLVRHAGLGDRRLGVLDTVFDQAFDVGGVHTSFGAAVAQKLTGRRRRAGAYHSVT